MRTTPIRSVLDAVLRYRGINPKGTTSQDMVNSIVEHINARVEMALSAWNFPEWTNTEERAFRQVWRVDKQYFRVSPKTGKPDEVFYIPMMTYYTVKPVTVLGDPPVGTLPTNTNYFDILSPVDTFIEYDQPCKRSIGKIIGVYSKDPRLKLCPNGALSFRPSEKGIDVLRPPAQTVFIHYEMPLPKYSMSPFLFGKVYNRGDVVLDTLTGECFQSLANASSPDVTDPAFWRRVPFLTALYQFVRHGAFADSLIEADKTLPFDERISLSKMAEEKAMNAFQQAVDNLTTQGQILRWNFYQRNDCCCCESQTWSGGSVTTLTDACEEDFGWVYPVGTVPDKVTDVYAPDIDFLRSSVGVPALDQVLTTALLVDSLITIVINPGTGLEEQQYILKTGTADPLDPGQVPPLDFNVSTNNKKWQRIS